MLSWEVTAKIFILLKIESQNWKELYIYKKTRLDIGLFPEFPILREQVKALFPST